MRFGTQPLIKEKEKPQPRHLVPVAVPCLLNPPAEGFYFFFEIVLFVIPLLGYFLLQCNTSEEYFPVSI